MTNNIFLVGPMGVGKSTIGRQLAQHMSLTFKDSDREIEERTGASISLIFELESEEGFRRREQSMIEELTAMQGIVLSTGGGSVLNEDNRRCLQSRGFVIYLQASIDQLLERTAHNRNRPLLQTDNPRARLESLIAEREPLYQSVADMVIQTGSRSIRQVIKQIVRRVDKADSE